MAFTQKLPEWNAPGVEPSEAQKQTGFQPGMKPPAQWFNWHLNWSYLALKELQEKAAEKSYVDAQLETIQTDIQQLQEDVQNADIPDASLTVKGKVQLSNKIDGDSEELAPTEKALKDALAAAIAASLPRTGGALTGPLRISSWGDISASSGGYVLYGHNCYLDAAGVVYRYRNTHATMGARGIVFRLGAGLQGAWMFDMGAIATTAGATFTPTLKRLLNTDDYDVLNTHFEQSDLWGAL